MHACLTCFACFSLLLWQGLSLSRLVGKLCASPTSATCDFLATDSCPIATVLGPAQLGRVCRAVHALQHGTTPAGVDRLEVLATAAQCSADWLRRVLARGARLELVIVEPGRGQVFRGTWESVVFVAKQLYPGTMALCNAVVPCTASLTTLLRHGSLLWRCVSCVCVSLLSSLLAESGAGSAAAEERVWRPMGGEAGLQLCTPRTGRRATGVWR